MIEKRHSARIIRRCGRNGSNKGLAVLIAASVGICSAVPAAGQHVAAAPVPPPTANRDADQYRLVAGDQVAIVYPYNPELNADGSIGPDGRLTLPLAGAVPIAGLTSTEAERRIAAALRLANIVEDARPSLSVKTYAATVYVGGEVRTPGAIRLSGPTDVMRAIILAGGVLDTARSKRVVVIRPGPDGRVSLSYVDLRAYVKTGGVGQNQTLHPQDVVFVPRSSIAEVNLWIDQYINRVLPFSRSLNYGLGDYGARATVVP